MRPRTRVWQVSKRLCTTAFLGLAGLLLFSFIWSVSWGGQHLGVTVTSGAAYLRWAPPEMPFPRGFALSSHFTIFVPLEDSKDVGWFFTEGIGTYRWYYMVDPGDIDWWPLDDSTPSWGYYYWGLPLWIPLAVLLIPTALLQWSDRRRIPANQCAHCGYNLTGNVTSRCPECGTPTTDRPPNAPHSLRPTPSCRFERRALE